MARVDLVHLRKYRRNAVSINMLNSTFTFTIIKFFNLYPKKKKIRVGEFGFKLKHCCV